MLAPGRTIRNMSLAIIGNCSYNALLENGRVRWLCWPRPDSSFVFGDLLDDRKGGEFTVAVDDAVNVTQRYLENTNVLKTVFETRSGAFELIDFAPRFHQYGRYYKPNMLVRILRPIDGRPMIRVRCRPVYDYGRAEPASWSASNHIEYTGLPAPLRLTTNISRTYVADDRPFGLDRSHHMVLTWGQPLETELETTAEDFLRKTVGYWRRWVKQTRVPRDYQDAVIRSALALKLHQYEDTGALLAASTTSLPEAPGSGRCWDYRYCWLRDSYFTLNALESMGQFEEMERFLTYLRDICAVHGETSLQPVYAINGEARLVEEKLTHLAGYKGEGVVRVGNQAHEHVQNDVYGEMILAIRRIPLDRRFLGTDGLSGAVDLIGFLLEQIERRMEEPDAGLWELRNSARLHAFTLLMHWAGARSAAEIGEELGLCDLARRGRDAERTARRLLYERCFDDRRGVITQADGADNLDSAMLLAVPLGFFEPGDDNAHRHVDAIRDQLTTDGGLLLRYDVEDDFGRPEAAFTVCSFWLTQALAHLGRRDEACALFERLIGLHNGLGLFAEDVLPATGEQSGNFPQTYSHVGLINTAFLLSRPWDRAGLDPRYLRSSTTSTSPVNASVVQTSRSDLSAT